MDRRELVQWILVTLASKNLKVPAAPIDPTIAAVAERILPGAGAAGVPAFIAKMLANWHTPDERDAILAGLTQLSDLSLLASIDQANPDWYARLKFLTVYGYCTSEVGMRELGLWPQPWRYDGCAPVTD